MALTVLTSVTPATLSPPLPERPLADNGAHNQAWTDFFQNIANRIAALTNGVTDGSNAPAGQVGEYLTASAGGVGLSSGSVAAIVSLPLTAGDWQVEGAVTFTPAATTHPTEIVAGVSQSATVFGSVMTQLGTVFNVGANFSVGTGGGVRISVAAPTTAYLLARSTFSISTMTAGGIIWARRVR